MYSWEIPAPLLRKSYTHIKQGEAAEAVATVLSLKAMDVVVEVLAAVKANNLNHNPLRSQDPIEQPTLSALSKKRKIQCFKN